MQVPALVGGVYALDAEVGSHWPMAATWCYPVGAPGRFGEPGTADEPAFQVNRGVIWSRGKATHQGADLANGRAGDPVRAASAGLVALAFDGDNGNGYGGHVVLAHELSDGDVIYTVYAHLAAGSLAVHAGDRVGPGDEIGRVGRTGRAPTPHLHFEVREPEGIEERWERARVIEPLAFIEARLAPALDHAPLASDSTGGAFVHWAASCGVLPRGAAPGAVLEREAWWRMLAFSAPGAPTGAALGESELLDSLIATGVLPEEETGAPGAERMTWFELARDVKRLRQIGVRLPHGPLPRREHEATCSALLDHRAPAAHVGNLRRRSGEPTVADACVLLADLSGPRAQPDVVRSGASGTGAHPHARPHGKRGAKAAGSSRAKAPTARR